MGVLTNYKQMAKGTTITTTLTKVLDAPADVAAYDLVVVNQDGVSSVFVVIAASDADAADEDAQFEVPAGTARTIRNVPNNNSKVYARAAAEIESVVISQSPASDASWR